MIYKKNTKTDKNRYSRAKSVAKRRNIDWKLTLDQWIHLVKNSVCHYCEGQLPKTGCALDRMNSKLGYIVNNLVPCCSDCNSMKGNKLSYDEMLLIWNFRKQKDKQS